MYTSCMQQPYGGYSSLHKGNGWKKVPTRVHKYVYDPHREKNSYVVIPQAVIDYHKKASRKMPRIPERNLPK